MSESKQVPGKRCVDGLTLLAMQYEIRSTVPHVFRDDSMDVARDRIWARIAKSKNLLRIAAEEARIIERDSLASIAKMEA
ncbi:hypothetical protein V5F41_12495 [Xanthobacter autotrophicus]|uniref:hypothetical protein n=1 Tax=Xanthobacter autotrophicus TaxID=280 RepID=UPI00372C497A